MQVDQQLVDISIWYMHACERNTIHQKKSPAQSHAHVHNEITTEIFTAFDLVTLVQTL